jgi:GNAT superfamily N-acetyltransferase
VIRELLPPETGLAFAAMHALRPHLADETEFVRRVDDVQRREGYRLVAAFGADGVVEAVAGFRVVNSLHAGHHVYVDDLSTLPGARRKGHGRGLLEWVAGEAQRLGCGELHLDSGVGADREDAHRLYFTAGMRIASHHFSKSL